MSFHVGQNVTMIQTWEQYLAGAVNVNLPEPDETIPEFGRVYTIRAVSLMWGREFLRFVEIVNPIKLFVEGLDEVVFPARNFRPVIERKTDISIFTSMLTPNRQKVDA
jgi:hypothetical protein